MIIVCTNILYLQQFSFPWPYACRVINFDIVLDEFLGENPAPASLHSVCSLLEWATVCGTQVPMLSKPNLSTVYILLNTKALEKCKYLATTWYILLVDVVGEWCDEDELFSKTYCEDFCVDAMYLRTFSCFTATMTIIGFLIFELVGFFNCWCSTEELSRC